jgi:hypothetical protein
VAATGLLIASPSQATLATAALGGSPTHFAMGASGYSTRVQGGDLNVESNRTAFQVIGCTNRAGLSKHNAEADLNLKTLLDVRGATTRVRTTSKGGVVSSWARNSIAQVRLGSKSTLAPRINGITSTSEAYHSRSGFHARTTTEVLSIDANGSLPGGDLPVPTRSHGRKGAEAQADGLKITLLVTGTKVNLAHSRATIDRGVKSALFGGSAYGSKANVVSGTLKSGPTPLIVMPCVGTNGHRKSRSIVKTNPAVRVNAGVLTVAQLAGATKNTARAYESAHIAKVSLGGGLVIKGINAKATVTKDRSGLHRSARGTSVVGIFRHGNRVAIPSNGVVRIAGLAKIETKVVHKIKGGISVIGARVTLLDSRTATVTLASAQVKITPSGL